MDWTIRPAVPGDADRLALIGAATFLDGFAGILPGEAIVAHCRRHHAADSYARHLADGATGWLVEAATGGAPLGYALVTRPDLPGGGAGDLELKRIYLLSRMRGSGAGAALMARAIGHARGQGAARLLLGVHVHNDRAIAFYHRHGFHVIGTRQFQVGAQLCDDLVLALDLMA